MANIEEQVEALRKQGLELARNNRLDEAEALFVRIVDLRPEDAEAWYVLSSLNGQLGRIDEAENCCRRLLTLRPDHNEAYMIMGNIMSVKGQHEKAIEHYQAVLRLDPRNSMVYCNLGNSLSTLGRYDEAEANFRAAINIDPQLMVAHYNLGNLYELQKRLDEAKSAYQNALRLNPHFAEAWHNLGVVLDQQGNGVDAESAFREALRLNPASAKAHHSLGHLLHKRERWAEAETAYREALRLQPNYVEARNNLGSILVELNRLDEAAQCFETQLAAQPDAYSHYGLGNVRLRQNRFAEAVDHYRQAVEMDPERAEFYSTLGIALRQHGDFADAEAPLREAIKRAPDNATLYANLGIVLTEKGRTLGLEKGGDKILDEALKSFHQALALNPDDAQAAVGEVTILERQGKFEQAYARLAPFLNADKPNVRVALAFASLCRSLRRCDEAIALLQRVLAAQGPQLDRDDLIRLHFTLGRLLDAADDYDKAFAQYRLGNDLVVAAQPFDPQLHVQRTDAIISNFSKDFMSRAPRAVQLSERPVFIVGMYRSGTTLVEQILSSHPAVFGAGELEELRSVMFDLEQRTSLPYPHCIEALTPELCTSLAQRYLDYIDGLAPPQAQRVTDKMPSNYLHLGLITLLFPGARIIHCVRDPLDTCLSNYFQNFEGLPFSYDLTHLGIYYSEYLRLMKHWRDVLDQQWLEVRYEDLVADLDGVSRTLVEYCGLEWDDRCLRFYESNRLISTASYHQVRQPVYTRSVGRWRHYERHLEPLRRVLGSISTGEGSA